MTAGPLHLAPVLVAEDEETDAMLLRWAFEKAGVAQPLVVARDGKEAVDYLEGEGDCADRVRHPFPCLLILDLKMPRMDGFRLLIELACRDQADFPVVVLTSSTARNDVVRSLFRGADKVISKPHSFEQLERELARAITLA